MANVGTDRWLCRYQPSTQAPAWQKVVSIDEIMNWVLFQNPQEMNQWIEANKDPVPDGASGLPNGGADDGDDGEGDGPSE